MRVGAVNRKVALLTIAMLLFAKSGSATTYYPLAQPGDTFKGTVTFNPFAPIYPNPEDPLDTIYIPVGSISAQIFTNGSLPLFSEPVTQTLSGVFVGSNTWIAQAEALPVPVEPPQEQPSSGFNLTSQPYWALAVTTSCKSDRSCMVLDPFGQHDPEGV